MGVEKLKLTEINIGGKTQSRVAINEETVSEYADLMKAGTTFPPVDVFHDGSDYWLADGFHRVLAAIQIDGEYMAATIHNGSRIDALKHSLGSNTAHGLRRTNADKRFAVGIALEELGNISDRAIADMCGVSHPTVITIRKQLVKFTSSVPRKGKDGKIRKLPEKINNEHDATITPATDGMTFIAPELADDKDEGESEESDGQNKEATHEMMIAHKAIFFLTQIRGNKKNRNEALDEVIVWCKKRKGERA